jgi:hypothetical protein
MKLPAIAIVAAFAAGIAIGCCPVLRQAELLLSFLVGSFITAALFLANCHIFRSAKRARRQTVVTRCVDSAWPFWRGHRASAQARKSRLTFCWSAAISIRPLRRSGTGSCATSRRGCRGESQLTSNRWRGFSRTFHPTARRAAAQLFCTPGRRHPFGAQQGDAVTSVVQARLPQVFRDEARSIVALCLHDQGVSLTAGLRFPELL